jgi:hypothetical protein
MGFRLFDQYTYLHFAMGIVGYFWGVGFLLLLIVHSLFEYIENTNGGIWFINHCMPFWPGGKPEADAYINRIGDTIGLLFGWVSAYYLDSMGIGRHWYAK